MAQPEHEPEPEVEWFENLFDTVVLSMKAQSVDRAAI